MNRKPGIPTMAGWTAAALLLTTPAWGHPWERYEGAYYRGPARHFRYDRRPVVVVAPYAVAVPRRVAPPRVVAPPIAYAYPPAAYYGPMTPAPVSMGTLGTMMGTLGGAITGAALGSTIGQGNGRTAAIAVGSAMGAVTGSGMAR